MDPLPSSASALENRGPISLHLARSVAWKLPIMYVLRELLERIHENLIRRYVEPSSIASFADSKCIAPTPTPRCAQGSTLYTTAERVEAEVHISEQYEPCYSFLPTWCPSTERPPQRAIRIA